MNKGVLQDALFNAVGEVTTINDFPAQLPLKPSPAKRDIYKTKWYYAELASLVLVVENPSCRA